MLGEKALKTLQRRSQKEAWGNKYFMQAVCSVIEADRS